MLRIMVGKAVSPLQSPSHELRIKTEGGSRCLGLSLSNLLPVLLIVALPLAVRSSWSSLLKERQAQAKNLVASSHLLPVEVFDTIK